MKKNNDDKKQIIITVLKTKLQNGENVKMCTNFLMKEQRVSWESIFKKN